MRVYLALRRWVDGQWAEPFGYKSLIAVGIAPLLLFAFLGRWGAIPAVGLFFIWTVFVAWRGYRLARASDAVYDRRTKYELSAEYHSTESALKAAFKRRRRK